MPPKNRTKRAHATERRERRKSFFSASKTSRGEWSASTSTGQTAHGGNRLERRDDARLFRIELAKYRQGRWVRDLAFAMRGFARRNGCTGTIYDCDNIRVTVDGRVLRCESAMVYDPCG